MKYLINNTGELTTIADYLDVIPNENEILIRSEEIFSFIKPMYNFDTQEFYEGATPEEIAEATKLVVPERVTAIQFLSALALSGIYETQIETIIENLAEPNRTIGLIALKRATVFERNNALIEIVRQAFNLTTQDVDNLFITASNIIL